MRTAPENDLLRPMNTEAPPISLQDYWDQLDRHDWYYQFSDDGGTYRWGSDNEKKLKKLAELSDDHKALYSAFVQSKFNASTGFSKDIPAIPKPDRPGSGKRKGKVKAFG